MLSPLNSRRMLVVTREPVSLRLLWSIGEPHGWHLETAPSGLQALERLQSGADLALVVLDMVPGDPEGLPTLRWLRRIRPDLPFIVISQNGHAEQKQEAMRLGAQEYLVQPLEEQSLQLVIDRYFTSVSEKSSPPIVTEQIEHIGEETFFVAASTTMRKLRTQIELLAQVDSPVLIVGEPGSGKELVARIIHKLSVRSGFRFVKVSCAALSSDLLESELFGADHSLERDGRIAVGKFELCNRGSLFLDAITEMPVDLQGKLFRVLQDGHFRSGAGHRCEMSARMVASTHLSGEQLGGGKGLREDLYYHLSSFILHVPPLRQRREDIPLLLGHFMNQLARHYSLPARNISPAVIDACQQHSWPGNLRELKNFVKCYLVTGDEQVVLNELQRSLESHAGQVYASQPRESGAEISENELEDSISGLKFLVQSAKGLTERNAIANALSKTQWNRKAAARLLKVSYRTLLYKIERYRMTPPVSHFSTSGDGGGK
jgi:two-component system, NtrC family, response regulator AtoC